MRGLASRRKDWALQLVSVLLAILAGLTVPLSIIPSLFLVVITLGLAAVLIFRVSFRPAYLTVFLAAFSMFLDQVNPNLISPDAIGNQVKWILFLLPMAAVLFFRLGRVSQLLAAQPASAKYFILFMLWSLTWILIRAGWDYDLLGKWLSVVLVYLLAFAVVPATVQSLDDLKSVFLGLLSFGMVVLIGSLLLLLFRQSDSLVMGRFAGVVANPIGLSVILATTVITSISFGLMSKQPLLKAIFLVAALLGLIFVTLTGSRGSLISLLLSLAVLGLGMIRIYKLKAWVLAVILFLTALFAIVQVFDAFEIDPTRGLLREKGGEEVRLTLLYNAFAVMRDDPANLVVGTGLGVIRKTYYARLGLVRPDALTTEYEAYFFKLLHNSFVETMVETGIPGLLMVSLAIGTGMYATWRVARDSDGSQLLLHFTALAVLIDGTLESFFNSIMLAPGGMLPTWYWPIIGLYSYLASFHPKGVLKRWT